MFQIILRFFIHNLVMLHSGSISQKVEASGKISVALSPIAYLAQRLTSWYIDNQDYVAIVMYAILVDTVVGIIYHAWKARDFDWKLLGWGMSLKILLAILGGGLFEVLPHFIKSGNIASDALMIALRLSVFMWPAGSAWMNMSALTGGKFPPTGWLKWQKNFNETLDFKSLRNVDNESKTN